MTTGFAGVGKMKAHSVLGGATSVCTNLLLLLVCAGGAGALTWHVNVTRPSQHGLILDSPDAALVQTRGCVKKISKIQAYVLTSKNTNALTIFTLLHIPQDAAHHPPESMCDIASTRLYDAYAQRSGPRRRRYLARACTLASCGGR